MAVMLLVVNFENGLGSGVDYIVKYTMPIFLLHTVFGEFLKAVLMELSVENTGVSRGVGTFVYFRGRIIASWVMKKTK